MIKEQGKNIVYTLLQKFNSPLFKTLSSSLSKLSSRLFALQSGNIHKRSTILLHISKAMIAVIFLQSLKFIGAPDLSYQIRFDSDYIELESLRIDLAYLHISNMVLHVLLFLSVLFLLKKTRLTFAKYLLLLSFTSYILLACLLWQYNLNLQYYFLLSMFVSCYIFDRHELSELIIAITIQTILFLSLHLYLPSLHQVNSLIYLQTKFEYLHTISQVNTLVFAISCVICALFIRRILAENWHSLSQYEASQAALLKKLFPAQLMPSLLHAQNKQLFDPNNNDMQTTQLMGVIFLDICQFTQLSTNKTNGDFSWQTVYQLFAKYDVVIENLNAKRIKTNGDQYILLVGLHTNNVSHHVSAEETIVACQRILSVSSIKVKIGAAFGLVTCGVFDTNNPNFDIWGETVIRAARLEALAQPNCILIDTHLYALTKNRFNYSPPSLMELKGLGEQLVYEAPSSNQ